MRIIGINGVWYFENPIWDTLVPAFKSRFPEAEFRVEEDTGCWPTEILRMRCFVDNLVQKYDDGIESLIIGHSMGGIHACALAKRLHRTKVRGIATIFSPH